MRDAFALGLLIGLALCQPVSARDPFPTQPAPKVWPPELMPDLQRPECVRYLNRFQPTTSNEVVVDTPWGLVTFRFTRGDGPAPDTLDVWDVPAGIVPDKWSTTLEENETDLFCFKPYEGL